jgi:uncharacterized protein YcsI (UPF0317 family)
MNALEVRLAARSGGYRGVTSGASPSQVQANLIVLPQRYASYFRNLCRRNPVPCCLLGENIAPGDPRLQMHLAKDSDIRKDAPGYNVYAYPSFSADPYSYRDGVLVEQDVADVMDYWQKDSVAFLSEHSRKAVVSRSSWLLVHLRASAGRGWTTTKASNTGEQRPDVQDQSTAGALWW